MIARGIQEEVLPLDLLQANEEASIVELIGDEVARFTDWRRWDCELEPIFAWCVLDRLVC